MYFKVHHLCLVFGTLYCHMCDLNNTLVGYSGHRDLYITDGIVVYINDFDSLSLHKLPVRSNTFFSGESYTQLNHTSVLLLFSKT